jgi:hypothetical protein
MRLVADDLSDIQVRAKPGWDEGLKDCIQPVFSFELPHTGDVLFNGPWGLRAQYWVSAAQGLAANSTLITLLAPRLLGAVAHNTEPDLEKIDLCASLLAASAKLWIQEDMEVLKNPPRDLAIQRWTEEADKGVALACSGLWAPMQTGFEVKGALLDPYGNEVVPVRKIRRHHDIHHYGFS